MSTNPDSGKGKAKVTPQIVLSDIEVSSEEDGVPLQRRMKPFHSGESALSGPPSLG
jgi:hypothetical protein